MIQKMITMLFLLLSAQIVFAQAPAPPATPHRPRVALVLEGGGAFGLAHIGVIKVLEELGIPIDMVVGTSMGSIVGGLYSIGYDAKQIEGITNSMDWDELFTERSTLEDNTILTRLQNNKYFASVHFDWKGLKVRAGLLNGRNILNLMDRLTLGIPSQVDFDKLPHRFRAVATDVVQGDVIVLDHGNLAEAMRSSMSIPALFEPFLIDGHYLVDGGVVRNLPVDVAKKMGADIIIAIDLYTVNQFNIDDIDRTPYYTLSRSLDAAIRANVKDQIPLADFVFSIDMKDFQVTDFAKGSQIINLGEAAAREQLEKMRAFWKKHDNGARPLQLSVPQLNKAVTEVVIAGQVSDSDRKEAAGIYAGAVGLTDPAPFLERAYNLLNAQGKYAFIRTSLQENEKSSVLVISLIPKVRENNNLQLGVIHNSYYADKMSSSFILTPGITFRNITNKKSVINIDVQLLDAPGAEISYSQPIIDLIRVKSSLKLKNSNESFYRDNSVNFDYQNIVLSADLCFENPIGTTTYFSLGGHFDWMREDDLSALYPGNRVEKATLLHATFYDQNLDSPILPSSGLFTKIKYAIALKELGSDRFFQTINAKGGFFIPIGDYFSMGLKWLVGADFTEQFDDFYAAPVFYKPRLADRLHFSAPMTIQETLGSVVAGGGIDVMWNLSQPSHFFSMPLFIIATTSVGSAIQELSQISQGQLPLHGNATLGAGLRISDAFGIHLRGGANLNIMGKIHPFLALDIGTINL